MNESAIKRTLLVTIMFVMMFGSSVLLANGWEFDLGPYPMPEDWIWIDLIVNIANNTKVDKAQLAAAVGGAGMILNKAGIHPHVRDVNENASYGDTNDPSLTADECRDAQRHGEQELDRICGAGKGLKITIGDINDPNIPLDVLGLAVHGNPVVIVEPDPNCLDPNNIDPNSIDEWAKTIAHELCHALTIEYDINDANDPNNLNNLMWWQEGSGTELNTDQMEEIRRRALARGRPYPTDGWNWWRPTDPWGLWEGLDAYGAELDSEGDATTEDGTVLPDNKNYSFADLRSVSVFCDGVGRAEEFIDFEIQLVGAYPPEMPFKAVYDFNILEWASDDTSDPEILLQINVENQKDVLQAWAMAVNYMTGETYEMVVDITHNKLLGCPGGYENEGNSSIHVSLPAHFLWQDTKATTKPMHVFVSAWTDFSTPGDIASTVLFDSLAKPFGFGISNPAHCPSIAFGCLGPACQNSLVGADRNTPSQWPSDLDGVELIGIFGNCFDSDVVVKLDGMEIGSAEIDGDGRAEFWLDTKILDEGLHTVIMQESTSGPRGRRYAAGILSTMTPIPGDVNVDFKVDMKDLAIMADFWLISR